VLDPLTNFTTRALVRTHYSLALFDHIQRINFVFTEKGGRGDILLSETDILLRMGIAPGGGGGGGLNHITTNICSKHPFNRSLLGENIPYGMKDTRKDEKEPK